MTGERQKRQTGMGHEADMLGEHEGEANSALVPATPRGEATRQDDRREQGSFTG